MKHLFLLTLACAGSLTAVAAPAKVTASAVGQSVEKRLNAILQSMVKKNSEDFYEAAAAVYDSTAGDESVFFTLMQKAAQKGNPAAQLWLARFYAMQAPGDASAATKALRLMEQAAAKKYVPAMVEYAGSSHVQNTTEAQQKRALAVLMDACKLGSAKARALYLMLTGRMSSGGLTQPEIASELKKKNYYLEEMVAAMQPDSQSGMVWMVRASEHGSAFAPFALCQVVSPEEADGYMKLAVERHLPAALGHVGTRMVLTETVKVDGMDEKAHKEGLRMLSLSAMMCTPSSLQMLAYFYANGQGGAVSKERIYELFRLAHAAGEPDGTAGMGYCMVLGAGCRQDAEAGVALMEQARDKGAQWVNQALASMYFNGDGVKADMRKAMDALSEDYLNGSRHAYAMMAALTAIGNESARPNPSTARVYLNMAIQNGDMEAQAYYDAFVKEGKWRFLEELAR